MGLGRFRIIICRDEKNTFQPTGIKAWKIKGASVLTGQLKGIDKKLFFPYDTNVQHINNENPPLNTQQRSGLPPCCVFFYMIHIQSFFNLDVWNETYRWLLTGLKYTVALTLISMITSLITGLFTVIR
jgi:hypothetical protein